jgi:mRNA-degrading endonuclease toxin of MazEF toxin-antitoxin module
LTSARFDERSRLPNAIAFQEGECGLPKRCVAQADQIAVWRKDWLDLAVGPLGELSQERMRDVVRSIGWVIDAECEPG